MDNTTYQYQPLKGHQIRILHLAPDIFNGELLGELHIINLDDDDAQYDALSYTWGDFTPASTIQVSGSSLPLTKNLALAIHCLRHPSVTLKIWADAICINQNDFSERAAQVQLMRQVFTRAQTVHSWIYEPGLDERCEAVKALQSFRANEDASVYHGLGPDPNFWDPVTPIFRNAYWSRAWVQQEVLNARTWIIHCKHTVFPGESIDGFFNAMHLMHKTSINTASALTWLDNLHLQADFSPITTGSRYPKHRPLIDLLRLGFQLSTTDPRDRVYALMHSAEDYVEGGIVPDYSKSHVEVVIDAAKYHMRVQRNVEFLVDCLLEEHGVDPSRQGRWTRDFFPSWIPPSWLGKSWVPLVYELGDGYLWGKQQPVIPSVSSQNRLRVRAMRIDTIAHVLTRDIDFENLTLSSFRESALIKTLLDFHGLREGTLSKEAHQIFTQGEVQTLNRNILATALYQLYRLSIHTLLSNEDMDPFIRERGQLNTDLLSTLPSDSINALTLGLFNIDGRALVLSESGKLGIVAECDIGIFDEVWIVLGCALPIVLRNERNKGKKVVSAIGMPQWIGDKRLREFDAGAEAGEMVGDRIVQDIELV